MADLKTSSTFADCALAFMPSASLPPSSIQGISETLIDNGATIIEPARDGSIRLDQVTHIVANSIDFAQYAEAQAALIPVVTSAWAFHSAAKGRQMPLRGFSPDPRLIFSKVILTCADLPTVDKETISGAVAALGGVEATDLNRLTTHVCALSMDHPKCQRAKAQLPKVKIVLPHWFDDCFKLGRRIDEGPYLLPDPEILKRPATDHVPVPRNADDVRGAATTTPEHAPTPHVGDVLSARSPLTVFAHKTVMLTRDLALTDRLRGIIGELVADGGGRMADGDDVDVEDCDILVCHYRDGPNYIRASQLSKDVGNLAWLYHLITNNEWISPFRRLLHYPVPRNGIPGFDKLVISISNYGGDARTYVESLIRALGATHTRTMTADNTHLVTARNSGDKCSAAADWNVALVNHLWLEECYSACEMLAIKPKYVHFPGRTNLGEVVGQTSFDPGRLRELYWRGEEDGKKKRGRRKSKRDDEENGEDEGNKEDEGEERGGDVEEQDEDDTLQDGKKNTKKPRVKKATKSDSISLATSFATTTSLSTVASASTPTRSRPSKTPEDPIPPPTTGRTAKAKAIASLQDIAPDVALYEREKRRGTKDGLWGGKRAADEMDDAARRSSSPAAEGEDRPAKKQRPSLPPVEKKVVLTGFERWAQQPGVEERDRKKLRDMGFQIVQPTQPCDYLVAPHIVRTVKFLVALARGPAILSCGFIEKALELGRHPPDIDEFRLCDPDGEDRYAFSLETSIARARANRGRLLRGVAVFCTAAIRNGIESYKAVAEAHGALFRVYKGSGASGLIRSTTEDEDGAPEPVYLLSSNSPEERALWPRFEDMAEQGHMEPRIVAPDWLLEVVLRQQVWFEERYLARNFFRDSAESMGAGSEGEVVRNGGDGGDLKGKGKAGGKRARA